MNSVASFHRSIRNARHYEAKKASHQRKSKEVEVESGKVKTKHEPKAVPKSEPILSTNKQDEDEDPYGHDNLSVSFHSCSTISDISARSSDIWHVLARYPLDWRIEIRDGNRDQGEALQFQVSRRNHESSMFLKDEEIILFLDNLKDIDRSRSSRFAIQCTSEREVYEVTGLSADDAIYILAQVLKDEYGDEWTQTCSSSTGRLMFDARCVPSEISHENEGRPGLSRDASYSTLGDFESVVGDDPSPPAPGSPPLRRVLTKSIKGTFRRVQNGLTRAYRTISTRRIRSTVNRN